jgi:hypothetical protein
MSVAHPVQRDQRAWHTPPPKSWPQEVRDLLSSE